MAISIFSNSGKKNYGIKHFVLDAAADLDHVGTGYTPGSTLFIIETSKTYMLNNQHTWREVTLSNGGSGGGTVDDDTLYQNYDGGLISG